MLIRRLICIRLSVKFPHKSSPRRAARRQLSTPGPVPPLASSPIDSTETMWSQPYARHQIHIEACLDCRVTAGPRV